MSVCLSSDPELQWKINVAAQQVFGEAAKSSSDARKPYNGLSGELFFLEVTKMPVQLSGLKGHYRLPQDHLAVLPSSKLLQFVANMSTLSGNVPSALVNASITAEGKHFFTIFVILLIYASVIDFYAMCLLKD